MAILPDDPERFAVLLDSMRDALERAFSKGTNKGDVYHIRAWTKICRRLGTPTWRTDVAANSGLDPVGHRREQVLTAIALMLMYADMQPRSKKDPAANPRSAMQKLYGVAREHKKRGYKMVSFELATRVLSGMLHKFVEDNDTDALAPSRKDPLTCEHIDGMLSVADGTSAGGLTVDWDSYLWTAVDATVSVLAETGMRKADVSKATAQTKLVHGRLTFRRLTWLINGVQTAEPTVAQLAAMTSGGCWLVYGALKNDPYGEFFGSKPSWLPYSSSARRNACRSLVKLELAAARAGMDAAHRGVTPIFGPRCGVEWHHGLLDKIFYFLLEQTGLVPADKLKSYSVHSFRIHLACALYAAGCPNERIMAILRWKSEEALLIYARMNDDERASWVDKAKGQRVNSVVAANLPRTDADDWIAALRQSVESGSLGKAARDAAKAAELDLDDLPEPGG